MEGAGRRYDNEKPMTMSTGSELPGLSLSLVELKSNQVCSQDKVYGLSLLSRSSVGHQHLGGGGNEAQGHTSTVTAQ